MSESRLTTKECPYAYALNESVKRSECDLFRKAQSWGFDPKIIEQILTTWRPNTLSGLSVSMSQYPHVGFTLPSSRRQVRCYVANQFQWLGARHIIICEDHGDIRFAIYSYYTNNPDLHLSWHMFYDPSMKRVMFDEISEVVNTFAKTFKSPME